MRHSARSLRLELDHLTVETFEAQPQEPTAPAEQPNFDKLPAPTAVESTCVHYSCNACTFTCWAC